MRLAVLTSLAVAVCLIGAPAGAFTLDFYAPLGLTGAQEVPPSPSPGSGTGTAQYNSIARVLQVNLEWADLLAPVTASHLHMGGGPGTAGGVAVFFPGFPVGVFSGAYANLLDLTNPATYSASFFASSGGTVDGAEAALVAGLLDGHGYFNIHSVAFPAGEIRGDLAQVPAPIPEPATALLLGIGALGVLAIRRRR